jgi:hypothetical protein
VTSSQCDIVSLYSETRAISSLYMTVIIAISKRQPVLNITHRDTAKLLEHFTVALNVLAVHNQTH